MRVIPRQRRNRRGRPPRIAISQAEITADLHYPDSRPQGLREAEIRRRGPVR
jgi:hypothetical protein